MGFPTAYRVQEEGNEVIFCVNEDDGAMLNNYRGLLKNVVPDYIAYLEKDAVVVFDSSSNGDIAYFLKKQGYMTFGGSVFADQVERDRLWALLYIAKQCGLRIPETRLFTNIKDAEVFLKKTKHLKRWVFKPQGFFHTSYTPATSVLDKDYPVENLHVIFNKFNIGDFILQEFIDGVEMAWEAWYSNGQQVGEINMTFDEKKLFDHDKGPTVGGTVNVDIIRDTTNRLYKETSEGIEKILEGIKYTGPFDAAFLISRADGKPYFMEFTPRFGYPSSYNILHGTEDVGKVLHEYASGNATTRYLDMDSFYAGILVSCAPFPYAGIPKGLIIRYDKKYRQNIWFLEAILEDGIIQTNSEAEIAYICDYGPSLAAINTKLLTIASSIKLPSLFPIQYREDMLQVSIPRIKEAVATGYLE